MKLNSVECRVSSVGCAEALVQIGRADHSSLVTRHSAFTLLEVMIASAIFFMAMFSVLALVAGTLRNARGLQQQDVDAGMLAAELSLTNRLSESADSGDFGDIHPGYSWRREVYLAPMAPTNGLFQVDFVVSRKTSKQPAETRMSILLFRPESQQGMALGLQPPPLR